MPPYPNLCDLHLDDPRSPAFRDPGQWVSYDISQATNVARIIPRSARGEGIAVNSIPDIWAHALMFREALLGGRNGGRHAAPDHPDHDAVVAQWRGLLATIGLARLESFRIGVTRLRFAGHPGPLLQSAALSKHLIQPPDAGDNLAALTLDDYVIGLLMPRVLAMPCRELPKELAAHLPPWIEQSADGLVFSDPLTGDMMSPFKRKALCAFLENLQPLVQRDDLMALRINEFRTEVSEGGIYNGAGFSVAAPEPEWQHFDGGIPPHIAMLHVLPQDDGDGTVTDVLIGRHPGQARALLLDSGMLNDENARRLLLWNHYRVADLSDSRTAGQFRQHMRLRGIEVVEPDDLFEKNLIQIHSENAAVGHGPNSAFLLPVTPLAMTLFGTRGIIDGLNIEYVEAREEYRVTLDITLMDQNYQPTRRHRLSRLYPRGHVVSKVRMPTPLAIWPDFSSTEWKSFLVLEVATPEGGARLSGLFYDTSSTAWPLSEAAARTSAMEISSHRQLRTEVDEEAKERRVVVASTRPDAFWLEHQQTPSSGMVKGFLIAERAPRIEHGLQTQMRVGVDFGTTNTAVAISFPNGTNDSAQILPLRPQLSWPLVPEKNRHSEKLADAAFCGECFLPPTPQTPPMISAIQQWAQGEVIPQNERLLANNRIAYLDAGFGLGHIINDRMRDELRFGLKWNRGDERRTHVQGFIHQLAFQIVAEAVAQGVPPTAIDWRFSYPGAFDSTMRSKYEGEVKNAVAAALKAVEQDSANIRFVRESDAAFHYYLHGTGDLAQQMCRQMVVLDIGGNSSDLVFIRDGQVSEWQGSVELAGQHMLVDYWTKNFDRFVEELCAGSSISGMINSVRKFDNRAKKLAIEVVLNRGHLSVAQWSEFSHSQSEFYKETERRIRIAFHALIFYVAHVMGQLRNETREDVGLYLCGRGSLLVRHFLPELTDPAKRAKRFPLIDHWLSTIGKARGLSWIGFSEHQKQEVARGMVVVDDVHLDAATESALLPQLTSFSSQVFAPEDTITEGKLVGPNPLIDVTTGPFRIFLDDLVSNGQIAPIDDVRLNAVQNRTTFLWSRMLSSIRPTNPNSIIPIQPGFVFAIRTLLETEEAE